MERKSKMVIAQRGRPKILTPKRTEYGKQIRKAYENGLVKEKRANIQQYEPRTDGRCNTITTVLKDNLYVGKVERVEHEVKVLKPTNEGWKESMVGSATDNSKGFELSETEEDDRWNEETGEPVEEEKPDEEKTVEDYLYTAKDGEQYGIFKLSPRECGRLMDVRDEDIDKMLSVNSRSQCYKQFGNSIIVVVLAAIFSQFHIQGIKAWNDRTPEERKALLGYKPKER